MSFEFSDSTKTQLKILIDERRENLQLLRENETTRIRLETELDVIKRELDERQRDLQKDRFRIENLIRQEQVRRFLVSSFSLINVFLRFRILNRWSQHIKF